MSAVVAAGVIAAACNRAAAEQEVTPALRQILAGQPIPTAEPAVWTDLRAFYTRRAERPAWVNSRGPTENAAEALRTLGTARQHGFDPDDYGAAGLLAMSRAMEDLDQKSPERLQRVAEFDVRMTAALFAFGRDVAIGRTAPQSPDGSWQAHRTAPDYVATFTQALDDPLKWIESLRPPHVEYAALQKALHDLHGQKEKGGWSSVPAGVLKPGASGAGVVALRQRLAAGGHLEATEQPSNRFDGDVETAVKAFQNLHGIKATGIVDAATLAAMNVPIDRRIRQVALNLQRWRWMPDDLGASYFMVNIPRFLLVARENGNDVMTLRVVVGTPGQKTPVFSDEMETVVLSPYWNIPDSIVQREIVPAMVKDPDYVQRQDIEVLRGSGGAGTPVDAAEVDWRNPDATKGLVFRQRPGATNALGRVKFLFPNSHGVYFHDTPARHLFNRPSRAFSHGCVRVEGADQLAQHVLRDFPELDRPALLAAMQSGVEKHVRLKQEVPVHIVYFTSWVNDEGGLHFQPDIYGYDREAATDPPQR